MGETKELSIKNETYYFYDDMTDIKNFQSNLLKIDKKPYEDLDIYYIGYITIKKFDKFNDHENIHSVNPLHLIIRSATGYFKQEYGEKYLILDPIDKYEEVFSVIKSEIETINSGKKMYYKKNNARIGFNTDNNVPLNKQLKFPSLTIIIIYVFQSGKKLCPQIYLDECLYQL